VAENGANLLLFNYNQKEIKRKEKGHCALAQVHSA
jgi:hypothetical protein